MVVHRRKTAQPWPLGKTYRSKRLGDEPFKLPHILKINGFDSFGCIVAFWMPFSDVDLKARASVVGWNPVAQASR